MTGFDVAATAAMLAGADGGYEVVHESPGLEIGVHVLVAPEPDWRPSVGVTVQRTSLPAVAASLRSTSEGSRPADRT